MLSSLRLKKCLFLGLLLLLLPILYDCLQIFLSFSSSLRDHSYLYARNSQIYFSPSKRQPPASLPNTASSKCFKRELVGNILTKWSMVEDCHFIEPTTLIWNVKFDEFLPNLRWGSKGSLCGFLVGLSQGQRYWKPCSPQPWGTLFRQVCTKTRNPKSLFPILPCLTSYAILHNYLIKSSMPFYHSSFHIQNTLLKLDESLIIP